MTHYSSQEIDEIVDTLRRAKDRSKPAHILFGGGCSKSAGIPLAPELVTEIHELYPARCQKLADADRKKYGACMKLLSPNERRDLLAPYLTKARINWAHIALAQFMKEQFIERALTVNFDNLLARACGLLSLYPAIYDFGSAPTAEVSLIVSPAILHLHGQRSVDPKIAAKRFRDAETKYEAALRLTPRNAGILYNFGVALMRRAHRSTNSADAAELLKQAETKYNAALRINSNVPATLSARGSAMLEIAKLTRNKRKAGRLLKTSVESMRRAYELGHTSTYNLACAYALLGRADDCRFALEFAEKAGTLPALVHLEADEDFKALYSQRWFKALKRRLARKAA